jgi:hypothetical protein
MSKIMEDLRADHKAGLVQADPDAVEPGELVDYLYNLAKLQHSQDAIDEAGKRGLAKANQQLATEAQTAVAGGGKSTSASPVDPNSMSSESLKKHFQSLGMVE